jgi:D-arabinose 1-dehydrogenase-like Zn-dependent alcohol dehydrogenase
MQSKQDGSFHHHQLTTCRAMGLKVIGLDIADQALEEARTCGADHVFNSIKDKDWKERVLEITGGGVDAAVNFTASKKSYDDCPEILKPGQGLLMVVGIPREPLQLNALDIALGRYRVKGSNNGSECI